MPELPEVETIKRQLKDKLVGSFITSIEVRRASCYFGESLIEHEKIVNIHRTGKYLFVEFESSKGFIIHLKMTGRLVYESAWYMSAPHTRVVLGLNNNRYLYYWDARTFGYIKYVNNILQKLADQKKKLGPDPWEISEVELYKLCKKFNRPIKSLILDQALMSGVGNIYANDGLWEAKIDPRRESKKITKREAKNILLGLRLVMERGIATGGASDNSYVNGLGEKGSYQDEFRVYKRTGEPCDRCSTMLKRVVVGGRGSWVCEKCQK